MIELRIAFVNLGSDLLSRFIIKPWHRQDQGYECSIGFKINGFGMFISFYRESWT
jgi:hypothetical protein